MLLSEHEGSAGIWPLFPGMHVSLAVLRIQNIPSEAWSEVCRDHSHHRVLANPADLLRHKNGGSEQHYLPRPAHGSERHKKSNSPNPFLVCGSLSGQVLSMATTSCIPRQTLQTIIPGAFHVHFQESHPRVVLAMHWYSFAYALGTYIVIGSWLQVTETQLQKCN